MNKNIVFILEHYYFRDHFTNTRQDMYNYVKNNNKDFNIHIFFTDHDQGNLRNKILEISPVIILFFDISTFTQYTKRHTYVFELGLSCKIGLFIEDTYYTTSAHRCEYMKKVDFIVFWYKNQLIKESYQKIFPNTLITWIDSRFINIEKYKDYNLEKKYDILLYGSRKCFGTYKKQEIKTIQNSIKKYEEFHNVNYSLETNFNFYSLRGKLFDLLEKNKDKYNVLLCPEIGDFALDEKLSRLINQSYLTIVCSTMADVMVFKHLEIPASKSVILGSYPSDYKELYEGNIIEINEFMSDDEILKTIDNALADKNKLEEMSNRIYNKVREEHNLDKALESFNRLFNEVLSS